jgi:hypothetical protein
VRRIQHRYLDPLDRLWVACLEAVGLTLRRVPGAYATTDGSGALFIAPAGELDPDDCLAQMIFHELCHAAVAGPARWEQRDWGLDNESSRDEVFEHATLRTQAFHLRPLGLRTVLGPTTEFRAYYDALPEDPLAGEDPAIPLARVAIGRMRRAPFAPTLGEALARTREILAASEAAAALARTHARQPRPPEDLPPLGEALGPLAPFHPAGVARPAPGTPAAAGTCGGCGWWTRGRCLSTDARVRAIEPACERWEPSPSCEGCGACCREAFHTLALSPREPFVKRHPALVVWREALDGRRQPELPRPAGRCPPLAGDGAREPFRCSVYDERPKTCRDFARGGANCLEARRRVGLSL